jgi:hypothetical protein
MQITKKIKLCFTLFFMICLITTLISGCTKTQTTSNTITPHYRFYKMENGDIRLNYLDHPLFSFEYSEYFGLLDIYQVPQDTTSSKHSDVLFTIHQINLPEIILWVRVQEPWSDHYVNAGELLDYWVSEDGRFTDDIEINHIRVSGIRANNFKSFQVVKEGLAKETIAYPYNLSHRIVTFDNSGLIWEIKMFWFYQGNEPPEVQEYFDHVIETFKILK